MTLQAVVGSSQTLAFSPNARAVLNDPHAFMGTIRGFGAGDVLELANTRATGVSWSNGVLTIATASGSFQLDVAGSYAPNIFTVQPDGLGGTDVAGGFGDVHMTTFDGLHYDLQATGEFVAVRSINGTAWQIQIRTASAPGATSITTALAAQLGDDRVTFAVGRADPVYVDGMADTALHSGDVQSFAGGTLAELSTGNLSAELEHRRVGHRHRSRHLARLVGRPRRPGRTGIGAGPARQRQRLGQGFSAAQRLVPRAAAGRRPEPRRLRRCLARDAGRLASG